MLLNARYQAQPGNENTEALPLVDNGAIFHQNFLRTLPKFSRISLYLHIVNLFYDLRVKVWQVNTTLLFVMVLLDFCNEVCSKLQSNVSLQYCC